DGMELLKRVKQEVRFRQVPVIMQTAAASAEQVAEGLRNGAYYYLTKPFDGMVLASVVRAAVADGSAWRDMARSANQEPRTLILMQQARFRFRSLDDARVLAASLAQCLPDPTNMGLGLLELLVNAVEHGNVEITCEEKSRLLRADAWEEEVVRRLALPEYADRWVDLEYQRTDAGIEIVVRDDGAGFDWQSYQELDPKRAFEPNGRGIALARQLCFPALEYLGNGNTVRVKIPHGSAAA
ncbi:MAG: ATP-binding protein, partial [Burkholderiales bacterium]|nr:ATP-binding protein [Burkholderiales bacterium]